jgi:hypothetical protein
MVETAEDGDRSHATSPFHSGQRFPGGVEYPLRWTLVRPRGVVIGHILPHYAPEVRLAQDYDVGEALPPHAAEEPLTCRILPGAR